VACSIARAADLFGDAWTALIMRDVRVGVTRFDGVAGPPARVHHLACGQDATPVQVCAHCGDPLTVDNTVQLPGPGGRVGPGTQVIGPDRGHRQSPEFDVQTTAFSRICGLSSIDGAASDH
jgi:hypothetical protein